MHNMVNLEADGLQQQKKTLCPTPVSQEQEAEAIGGTGSPNTEQPDNIYRSSAVQFQGIIN